MTVVTSDNYEHDGEDRIVEGPIQAEQPTEIPPKPPFVFETDFSGSADFSVSNLSLLDSTFSRQDDLLAGSIRGAVEALNNWAPFIEYAALFKDAESGLSRNERCEQEADPSFSLCQFDAASVHSSRIDDCGVFTGLPQFTFEIDLGVFSFSTASTSQDTAITQCRAVASAGRESSMRACSLTRSSRVTLCVAGLR